LEKDTGCIQDEHPVKYTEHSGETKPKTAGAGNTTKTAGKREKVSLEMRPKILYSIAGSQAETRRNGKKLKLWRMLMKTKKWC